MEGKKLYKVKRNHSHTKTPADSAQTLYLQAYNVDQRLVGNVDLTQDLCDWNPWDGQVKRHEQREDGGEPVAEDTELI